MWVNGVACYLSVAIRMFRRRSTCISGPRHSSSRVELPFWCRVVPPPVAVAHLSTGFATAMLEDWDDEGGSGQQEELAREWNSRREQHYNVIAFTMFRDSVYCPAEASCMHRLDTEKVLTMARRRHCNKALMLVRWYMAIMFSVMALLRCRHSGQTKRSVHDFAGFKQGCAAGYEWGLLQGAASTLRVFAGQLQGLPVQEV